MVQQLVHQSVQQFDIAIAGGGIVGLTLACALKDSGLSVALIEPQTDSEAAAKGQAYALHQISSRIYQGIGVWPAIANQVQPFTHVNMADADDPCVVRFSPADLQTEALGHVAEHHVLLKALKDFLRTCNHVQWFCPAQVTETTFDDTGAELKLAASSVGLPASELPSTLRARLVVAADGGRSPIRQQAGIQTRGWKYWQSCVVATVKTEKSHQNTAYERFWPSGPMGILPLVGDRCRIVWTAPHAEAEAMLAMDDQQFLADLSQRIGPQMGQLSLVGERFIFPARLMHTAEYILPRLALVGDAAHTCHPVGGQGLNLGIRDAAALAEILQVAHQQGEDIGCLAVLKRYQRWRGWQNSLTLGFTDVLNRFFSNQWFPLVILRRLGLRFMQMMPPFKVMSLKFMAGLLGQNPQIAK
jgi:2-octaprenyl-6-methoxyphenol hydroxylase